MEKTQAEDRKQWIAPVVSELDVEVTRVNPLTGTDGGSIGTSLS